MLFNSLTFFYFFILVYTIYLLTNHRWQNRLLLVASYVFYGWWDWRFLSLIWISTAVDYFCALKIGEANQARRRKFFLVLSVVTNLGILGFFKYYNFFSESFAVLADSFGWKVDPVTLNIVLPVGISFYTFQSLSYTIDVFRKHIEPTKSPSDFALYVAFFPQLVAGPIERATHLLPQITSARKVSLEKIYRGCHLIVLGLFQKVFIADKLGVLVDSVFGSTAPFEGVSALIAIYAFTIQIYCDFAGYSNVARGLGACLGFEIMVNFNLPYFSKSLTEFWHRWHISLSSWLKDYVYIPLGGNKVSKVLMHRNLFVTMLLGGLWHGAAWKFVVWGAYHGILLSVSKLGIFAQRSAEIATTSKFKNLLKGIWVFHLVSFGLLIFRAESIHQAFEMVKAVFLRFDNIMSLVSLHCTLSIISCFSMVLALDIYRYYKKDLLAFYRLPLVLNAAFHGVLIYLIIRSPGLEQTFIYFQF